LQIRLAVKEDIKYTTAEMDFRVLLQTIPLSSSHNCSQTSEGFLLCRLLKNIQCSCILSA